MSDSSVINIEPTGPLVYCDLLYWLKRLIIYIFLKYQQRKRNIKRKSANFFASHVEQSYGQGLKEGVLLEKCQVLDNHPDATDVIWVGGFDYNGNNVSFRIGRGHNRLTEEWLFLEIPGLGRFQHPLHLDTQLANTDTCSFSAGGLKCETVLPMALWRFTYNGYLRKESSNKIDDKEDEFVHAKFSFNWRAFTEPYDFVKETEPFSISDAIARETWLNNLSNLLERKDGVHYEQFGELRGTLEIDGSPIKKLLLKSARVHTYGLTDDTLPDVDIREYHDVYSTLPVLAVKSTHYLICCEVRYPLGLSNEWPRGARFIDTSDFKNFHRYIVHRIHVENGMTINCSVISSPGTLSLYRTGFISYANASIIGITSNNIEIWNLGEDGNPSTKYSFNFWANGVKYTVEVEGQTTPIQYHREDRHVVIHEMFSRFIVNGKKGVGVTEFCYRNYNGPVRDPVVPLKCLGEPAISTVRENSSALLLEFTEPACCSSRVVGGKGAQLAQLSTVEKELQTVVPRGFCLTLTAFNAHIQKNSCLFEKVSRITDTVREKKLEQLQEACSECVKGFRETPMCKDFAKLIEKTMMHIFGEKLDEKYFAIRSSSAGEDGLEASSAGQMETFLGVKGQEQILEAVQKCWGSAFTYQAVTYRRQHGQILNVSVGVVIQEMVPSEVSGVMFTADPVTGNNNLITIDANYGLGESVVSGRSNPDIIKVSKSWKGELNIAEKQVGNKDKRLDVAEHGGLQEKSMKNDEKSQKCCLTDEMILRLCRIGMQVEKLYGSPRDIEWAIKGQQIYLFQARPVTAQNQETEDELLHEFDSALASGSEWITKGNVSEVCPGALSALTLGMGIIGGGIDYFNYSCGVRQHYPVVHRTIFYFCNQLYLNLMEIGYYYNNCFAKKDSGYINVLGHHLPDLEEQALISYGDHRAGLIERVMNFCRLIQLLKHGRKKSDKWTLKIKDYTIGEDCKTSMDVYKAIDDNYQDLNEAWSILVTSSAGSSVWTTFLMGIIIGKHKVISAEHYGDLATLLAQCKDVYSAEVPLAIKELSRIIVKNGFKDKFLSLSEKECVEFLNSNDFPDLQKKYQTFMERHGHRCIKEVDFREKSWKSEPTKLARALQQVVKLQDHEEKEKENVSSIREAVDSLKSPVSPAAKFLLRTYFVPKARAAVGFREQGKSLSVQMNDVFKRMFWKLADFMVREGFLPEEELLFHLTHYEIGVLLETRSSRLITKAKRRMQVSVKQESMKFPYLLVGYPEPIVREKKTEIPESFKLTGTPVSVGVIEGVARVVKTLEDASSIQKNDILIASFTDIGWSPFFPLISGLVTEIGGIVSHGAVIAREYGIPCIVNVPEATEIIQTGDRLILDGKAGFVSKLADTGDIST